MNDLELAEVLFTAGLIQGPLPSTRRESERGSITRALHDTLFQGLFGPALVPPGTPEKMPANLPGKSPLDHALQLMRRVIEKARVALQGLRPPERATTGLEKALADFGSEFTPDGVRFQIFVVGRPKAMRPTIQEQIYLIGREAIANAFQYSKARSIEVEVVYLLGKLGVIIRDDGCGIDPQAVRLQQNLHRRLLGMYERARNIGAHFEIWSRCGSGTEVEISILSESLLKQPKLAVA